MSAHPGVSGTAFPQTAPVRVQLHYRTAVAKTQGLAGGEGDGTRTELGLLLDAVRTFAAEAAKHPHLAPMQRRFDETAHELQKLLSQRRRAGHFVRG